MFARTPSIREDQLPVAIVDRQARALDAEAADVVEQAGQRVAETIDVGTDARRREPPLIADRRGGLAAPSRFRTSVRPGRVGRWERALRRRSAVALFQRSLCGFSPQ